MTLMNDAIWYDYDSLNTFERYEFGTTIFKSTGIW